MLLKQIRAELKEAADPDCTLCYGEGYRYWPTPNPTGQHCTTVSCSCTDGRMASKKMEYEEEKEKPS
jgi:hypothetical protein